MHTNFPHHRDGLLSILGCANDRTAVAATLQHWRAFDFENAAAQAGLCATAMRSFVEWDAHPHGAAVSSRPVVAISRIGDAPAQPLPMADRPLAGVRVLDLTRVIAGPVCGRTLAAHGAEVLGIASPNLPNLPRLLLDTNRGKRSAFLELREATGAATLRGLLEMADVFVQGYHPGGLRRLGFGPEDAARMRPGIVYVSLSAYGDAGPWADRRGFDSLTQTASGFNHAETEAAGSTDPKPLPCQSLDHASGYLMALGAIAGLARRVTEGGSWHVRVSLARTGRWIRDLGRMPDGFRVPQPRQADIEDLLETSPSAWGALRAVRHAAAMDATPPRWDLPSAPLGGDAPAWLA